MNDSIRSKENALIKKVIITNGSGFSGKDTFAKMLNTYHSVYKYSSIDIVKEMTGICGIDRNNKEEDTRKLWSDIKQLVIAYDDIPYRDVAKVVEDFNNNFLPQDLLLVDIREPEEIERAKIELNAITVLVMNQNIEHITSNNSDSRVFDYEYDYVVDNSGSLEDLEREVKKFVEWINGGI